MKALKGSRASTIQGNEYLKVEYRLCSAGVTARPHSSHPAGLQHNADLPLRRYFRTSSTVAFSSVDIDFSSRIII